MNYRLIENEIRNKYKKCNLDDWIIECKDHVFTKIIALNIFVDIHLESLDKESLLKNIFDFENHLDTKQEYGQIDTIDKPKGIVFSIDNLRKSKKTEIQEGCKLSRIVTIKTIKEALKHYRDGENYSRAKKNDDSEIDMLLEEADIYLKNKKRKIPFKMLKDEKDINLVWFTNTLEIESFTKNKDDYNASKLRDLLGLYFGYSEWDDLIEVEFELDCGCDTQNIPHKPTVFHSGFGRHWHPTFRQDGWGTTINLQNFTDGVSESVVIGADWPSKSIFKRLGKCNEIQISEERWELYLDKRIADLKERFKFDQAKSTDLEYFLNKIES